ncbi:hypothetical protein ID866_13267 [Astraeus odoratus]|nr:hypothetical protein ID866_13267 [Astraeus odoratus]
MQCHYLLMEGVVDQQQLVVSRLVKMSDTAGSEGVKVVAKGLEELQGEGEGDHVMLHVPPRDSEAFRQSLWLSTTQKGLRGFFVCA